MLPVHLGVAPVPCNVRCPHGRGLRDRQERQLARQTGRGGGSRHAGPGARTSPAGGCTAGSSAWSFTSPWGRKGQAGDGGLGMKGKKPQFAAFPLPGRHGRLHSGHLSSHAGGVGPWRLSCGSPAASAPVTSVSTQRAPSAPARPVPPARSVGGRHWPPGLRRAAHVALHSVPPGALDSNVSPPRHLHTPAPHTPPLSVPSLGPETVRSSFTSPDPTAKPSPVRRGALPPQDIPSAATAHRPRPHDPVAAAAPPPPPCPAVTGPPVLSITRSAVCLTLAVGSHYAGKKTQ